VTTLARIRVRWRRPLRRARRRLAPVTAWLHRHRVGRGLLVVVVALAGALAAITLWGSVHHDVGPVRASFSIQPRWQGGIEIDIPPLGQLAVDSHAGPLHVKAVVTGVDLPAAERVLHGELTTEQLEANVTRDVREAIVELLIKLVLLGVLGGAASVLIVFRRTREVVLAAGTVVVALVVSGAIAVVTYDSDEFAQPRFTGVLASAPTLIGNVEDIPERFDVYRAELAKLVTNVSKLYDVTTTLPGAVSPDAIPILWVSDIHDNPEAFSVMQSVVGQFGVRAVVDTGDISDHGTEAENALYRPIADLQIPYIYVRGNHDSRTVTQTFLQTLPNVHVLDDGAIETIAGITWAGIGDPNFTPDRSIDYGHGSDAALQAAGAALAQAIDTSKTKVDVALVHEPTMAEALPGHVPLVLVGHTHKRDHQFQDGTIVITQGSTGGAGLRNLEGDEPLPLEMSVLYFDPETHLLLASDDITVSGLGAESVRIQRHRLPYYQQDAKPVEVPTSGAPS
jgi:predicted phosphodiesterase